MEQEKLERLNFFYKSWFEIFFFWKILLQRTMVLLKVSKKRKIFQTKVFRKKEEKSNPIVSEKPEMDKNETETL
mgnify:CR=1 FL=1